MPELFVTPKEEVDVVLLCGGKGKRFREATQDLLPKSLFQVSGKELIRYSLDSLGGKRLGRLIFAVDYQQDKVIDWVKEAELSHEVTFSGQEGPGVVGAIKGAVAQVRTSSFAVCNTDEIRDGFDFSAALDFHDEALTLSTMVATRANQLYRHRLLELGERSVIENSILKPAEYRERDEELGHVNTGFIIFNRQAIGYIDEGYGHDWSAITDPLINARQMSAFVAPELAYYNVGTIEELLEAEARSLPLEPVLGLAS